MKLGSREAPPLIDDTDPDFSTGAKSASNTPLSTPNGPTRKSGRKCRVKIKGERSVRVDSSMTLKDLKVSLLRMFNVAPFDQNLYLNGLLLDDSSKTLAELEILPQSVIYLRADEPTASNGEAFDDGGVETGFQGTGLLM